MLRIYLLDLFDYFKNKLDYSALAHRLSCTLSGLLIVYYLIMCIFSLSGALDDMELYEGLGFSHSFGYHLIENYFLEIIQMFLPVTAKFFVYLILYHRTEKMKFRGIGLCYFGVAVLLCTFMFAHALSLDFSKLPPYTATDDMRRNYYRLSRTMMLQSAGYLISYLLHVKKIRSIEKWITENNTCF